MAGGAAGSPQEPDSQYSSVVSSLPFPCKMRRWHVAVSCTVRFRLHLQPGDRRRGLGSATGVHSSRTGPGDPAHHHSGLHEFLDYLLRRGSHGRRQCVLYSQGEEGETGPHSGEQRHTEAGFGGSVTACNAVFCACFPCLAISA